MEPKDPDDADADADADVTEQALETGAGQDSDRPPKTEGAGEPAPLKKFPIVGIGASAGGLEALEALAQRLSADGMAFVVLQHLAPAHGSMLPDILARDTTLSVVTARDGARVEVNHIYVAPPNADLEIHGGVLRLIKPPPERRGPRPDIDAFFRSLAADQGAAAIGVVLSGAGTDGTLGLAAIKDEGGITFAQEPTTAGQPSMPQSALDAGHADVCLGPAEIGDELMRLSRHPYVVAAAPRRVLDHDSRDKLFALLRGAFGVDFAEYKQSTIERRIERRMALHKLDRLDDYFRFVESKPAELKVLYGDLLIGVTRFFRDKAPFEALKSLVFPRILDGRSPDVPIRIWAAGCATGEEPFSIAIALLEHLGDRAPDYKVQIFATDIDQDALARARQAVYPPSIEADVSPERLQRFFCRADKGYRVSRAIRDMVVFARHNLGKDPPYSRLDLVSCRNVLIYMQPPLQKRLLRVFHYSLHHGAFLLLGTSESVGDSSELFRLVDRRIKLYTKKETATPAALDLSFRAGPGVDAPRPRPAELRPTLSLLQLADRKVLEQYGPPGVVVDEQLDILQYRGKTGRFFEPTPGIATMNLLRLARPELLPELKVALDRALTEDIRVVSGEARLLSDKEEVTVRMDVTPLPDPGTGVKTLLVLFNEHRAGDQQTHEPGDEPATDARVQDLERELAVTKEYLQTTIEEFEAANEELQSSNEELQSSNEELETSKEELQSTNEELVTLNEELQNRMAQLDETSDDLHSILSAVSAVVVLVGMDGRIRRFSTAAARLLNLIPEDVGRPIAYVRTVIKARDIEHTVADAIDAVSSREQRVRCADGLWYTMRITPHRSGDHVIRGAVIEFIRTVDGEQEAEPAEVRGLGGAILDAVPQALALLDDRMCVTWGNRAFLDLVAAGTDIFGRPLEDIWSGKSEQPEVWRRLEDAAVGGQPFHGARAAEPVSWPLEHPPRFSARRLPPIDGRPPLTLVMVEFGAETGGE